jgi:Concanavalin A-like lectin/glucanases superfamily
LVEAASAGAAADDGAVDVAEHALEDADAVVGREASDADASDAGPPVRAGLPTPLAYWPLDARDFVSPRVIQARIGGFDGLVANNDGQVGRPAQVGEGYGFDLLPPGTLPIPRQAIVVPPRPVDPLELTTTGTWSAWVSFSVLPSTWGTESLMDKGGYGNDFALEAIADSAMNNEFAFYFGRTTVTSGVLLQTGIWYHVVATFDSSSQLCVYVNGGSKACAPASPRLPDVQPLKFGDGAFFTGRELVGTLDEIAIWGVALTDTQVKSLYQLGAQGIPLSGN